MTDIARQTPSFQFVYLQTSLLKPLKKTAIRTAARSNNNTLNVCLTSSKRITVREKTPAAIHTFSTKDDRSLFAFVFSIKSIFRCRRVRRIMREQVHC